MTCPLCDGFLSPSIFVALALGFTGRMTLLFWLEHSGLTAVTDCSPSPAEIFHLCREAGIILYHSVQPWFLYYFCFPLLPVIFSLTILQIAWYPVRHVTPQRNRHVSQWLPEHTNYVDKSILVYSLRVSKYYHL